MELAGGSVMTVASPLVIGFVFDIVLVLGQFRTTVGSEASVFTKVTNLFSTAFVHRLQLIVQLDPFMFWEGDCERM